MKSKKLLVLLVLALLLCVMLVACDEAKTDDPQDTTAATDAPTDAPTEAPTEETTESATNADRAEEAAIIDMFMKYGTYYDDGWYRFHKSTTQGDVAFGYTFAFDPINRTFVCSTMVSTFVPSAGTCLEDYGVVVFRWGDLANGYYSGDHRLTDLSGSTVYATIAFEYSVANSTTHKVTTNTYSQLSQTDINEYATTCLQCLEQGLSYAQTIVSAYTNNITIK